MKKAICSFLLFLAFVTVCFAQQNNSNTDGKNEEKIILKAGAQISAQLQGVIDVETANGGDDFVLKLTEDITGGGVTLLKGSEVLGRVVRVKKISSEDNVSEISLSFDFIKYVEDYLTFKAIVMSENPSDPKVQFVASPVFKGATVISTKGKNLQLAEGLIFQLKLNKDLVAP